MLFFTDNEEPVFYGIPSDVKQNTNPNSATANVTWTPPIASDNANEGVTVASSHNSGDSFEIGTTKVTYTATDPYGNSAYTSFDVVITGKMEGLCLTTLEYQTVFEKHFQINIIIMIYRCSFCIVKMGFYIF